MSHSLALKQDGTIWAWGDNEYGQLGDSSTSNKSIPVQLKDLNDITDIAAGGDHSLALKKDGTVWAWGDNEYGQLGDTSTSNKTIPIQVKDLNDVTAIAAGYDHSLALKQNATVWAWGNNEYGQLGDSSTSNKSIPVQVKGLYDVTAIAAGYNHSLVLKQNATVWAWGVNIYGQLGDSNMTNKSIPVQVKDLNDAIAITAGSVHSLAIKQDGTVWAWGMNIFAQLGNSSASNKSTPLQVKDLNDVTKIAGDEHSLALKQDGTVWAWGWNKYGQLGDSSTSNKSIPIQVKDLNDVTDIAAGYEHSIALKQNGTVWAWGNIMNGQLGDSSTSTKYIPTEVKDLNNVTAIAAGYNHNLALKQNGTVWAWGDNSDGQLGDSSTTDKSIPVQVKDLNDVSAITAGWDYSLALKQDGTVWAWGWNKYGQLGDSSTSNKSIPIQVKDLNDVIAITARWQHSLALKQDGTVWAWGDNIKGQLGDSSTTDKSIPVQVKDLNDTTAIAAGSYHSLALKQDGTVWAWGWNHYGQLGDGTFNDKSTPIQLNNLSNVSDIDAGSSHSLIIKKDRSLWAWGDNTFGQLGIGLSITQTKGPNGQGYLKLFHPPLTVCSSNCDYTSIQLAIESASLTNTILVSDGTYIEHINFKGKNIKIQSVNGPEKTIIQGNASNSVITFNTSEQNSAILKGFTIKNGISANGGGIYISGASPFISECIITNNNADNKGGGVYCENASPKFINCIFHNNTAETAHALYLSQSSPEIINCTISKNGYPMGEGIVIYDVVSSPVILNSILWNNGDEIILQNDATVTVEYSNIEGGYPGIGNIQSDPLFIDLDHNNFHILPDSPCLNAGTNINAATIDIDYQTRPMDEYIDIGADEARKNTKPTVNFSSNQTTGFAPLNVQFTNLSTSYDITEWHWDFGDGETSMESNPTHTYTNSGYYSVTLEVISDGGTSEKVRSNYIHVFESVETFYVNASGGQDKYTRIQSAIDVSNMGDIIVEPGTYYESIDYKGKRITIKSSQGAEQTIIDGNKTDAVVKFINGEDSGAVLKGFSLTNGFSMNGGGIYISGASSPTIIECLVFNNQAQKEGGGIAVAYSSMPLIIDCEFRQNTARNGAGIACLNSSSASFQNTSIIENQALKNGGGVYVYYGSFPDIQYCEISNNMAQSRGGGVYGFAAAPKLIASHVNHNKAESGGGIMLDDALFPLIEKTMIRENTATTGGGLYMLNTPSPEIQNSLIVDNQAAYGGGLYVKDVSAALINYSTFANNMAYSEGSGIYGSDVTEFVFRNGILWHDGNEIVLAKSDVPTVEFSNVRQLEGIFSGTGNINQDPIFAGPKNYHLALGSSCKNVGNATHAPTQDIAGVKRPVGSGFDIGAYEELNVPPVTNGKTVTTNEDISVTIQLIAEDDDDDPLTYVIVEQPQNGTITGEGANVTYKPKVNYCGNDYFRFKTNDTYYDSNVSTVNITIIAIADAPILNLSSTTQGNEDIEIPIPVNTFLSDIDGSEVLSPLIIWNVPEKAVLSQGIKNPDNSYTLKTDQLSGLTLLPALHDSADITLTVEVTATETTNSDSATIKKLIRVDIIPVADKPELMVTPNAGGNEDTAIPLIISTPSLIDQDQSERLSDITLFNIPDHVVLSAGTQNANGTWTLTSTQLTSLNLVPGKHIANDFTLTVSVTATETENNDSATATQTILVDIIPVADKPTLVVSSDTTGNEDTPIQLTISPPSLVDQDQSEILSHITVSKIPEHAVLSAGTKNLDGTWTLISEQLSSLTLTPGKHIADDFYITVSVTATETENSDYYTTTQTISVDVIPVADKPILIVAPNSSGNEDTPIQLFIDQPLLVDKDQSEILSNIKIFQVPDHAILSAGKKNDDDSWTLTKEQLTSLTITPGLNDINDFAVIVSVISTETENSDAALTTETIAIDVIPVNDLPTISAIDDQVTKENTPTSPIRFTIDDVETAAEKLILDINSSNSELIPQSRIIFEGIGKEKTVILLPEPRKFGLSTINISVKDESNESSETSFILTVQNAVRLGDFNDNGLIELIDSQIALNFMAGYDESVFYIEADINGNQKIDLQDVIYIQQYLNNLPGIHDPNNDKNIDLKDVIILLQFLTGINNKLIYPEVYHDIFLSIDQVIYILNQVK
ncbi:PKD domain protein [Candidatus Magnetomorum sp. HK-1]|nr:PKD domain protein [Candidatus Magnetomorum sp. HK-1]